jgi:hypothetical protein
MAIEAPKIGSTVVVQLFDGRKVQAVVKAMQESVAGKTIQIAFGSCTAKIGVEQILK